MREMRVLGFFPTSQGTYVRGDLFVLLQLRLGLGNFKKVGWQESNLEMEVTTSEWGKSDETKQYWDMD